VENPEPRFRLGHFTGADLKAMEIYVFKLLEEKLMFRKPKESSWGNFVGMLHLSILRNERLLP
jgi:hypothetical protein